MAMEKKDNRITELEKEMMTALRSKGIEDFKKLEERMKAINPDLCWVAVYGDEFWSNNATWIINARDMGYKCGISYVRISTEQFK